MKKDKIIIGSRGSKLALIYAEKVIQKLKKFYSNEIKLSFISKIRMYNRSRIRPESARQWALRRERGGRYPWI
mgnify:CR=1 FL=1